VLLPWLLVLGAAGAVVALVTTGALDRFTTPPDSVSSTASRGGTINVAIEPADAQLFVYVGRGPARAEGLAVGSPHEFVVLDEGLAPSRAAVPKGATWVHAEDAPLYELAVQAQPAPSKDTPLALGDPLPSAGEVDTTTIGTVRIITNPPGAKVYRFVGTGPALSLPVDSIDEGQELLVFHPQRGTRREVIGPSDWRTLEGKGAYEASLDVALPEAPSVEVADPADD
ncbi:MAG: hypothetical protein WBG86_02725, partial [Polyangiales bacterium]